VAGVGGGQGLLILSAAFLAGGLLLALEVIWFRILLLFTPGTSLAFAVMLAVVLLGIALGGLAGGMWLARRPSGFHLAPLVALVAAVAVVAGYAGFPHAVTPYGLAIVQSPLAVLLLAARLMLPTCIVSGLIFTLLGQALHARTGEGARTAGALTLANTTGAMVGALLGGFLLLPRLGMERSVFVLALGYGLVAVSAAGCLASRRERIAGAAGALVFVAFVALFPFGLMERQLLGRVILRWSQKDSAVAALKEGLTETVLLIRRDFLGKPSAYRLVTNSYSMAGNWPRGLRYMGLFAWLPVATHPAPRKALVISYGLGTTARALVDTGELERIDVVDTSRDILDLSPIVHSGPGGDPLSDPRVHTHVEDGRFFLSTTDRRFDIITGEPPPPKMAGIASLYSREFFALAYDHLTEGGMVSYWLPVFLLDEHEARSIMKAFCSVFDDCSLWVGYDADWMLVGSRGRLRPISEERLARQWGDPRVGPRLREAGIDSPAELGALFLGDATTIASLTAGVQPLDDDHPYRVSPRRRDDGAIAAWAELMATRGARVRFARSELIRRWWPAAIRQRSLQYFAPQGVLNAALAASLASRAPAPVDHVRALLLRTPYRAPVLWILKTSPRDVALARAAAAAGQTAPEIDEALGLGALARRDYGEAARLLGQAAPRSEDPARVEAWRRLAQSLAGGGSLVEPSAP